jgi:nicotinate phosphoribosyltransferase
MRDALENRINEISSCLITEGEVQFLRSNCPYLYPWYIDWLAQFKPDPRQIDYGLDGDQLVMTVKGPWCETIYWEVPLLAAITEQIMHEQTRIVDMPTVEKKAIEKAKILHEYGCKFAEFGTRRRFSDTVHEAVLDQLICHGKEHFIGTSNVYFAHQYGIRPIGTMAHEWVQAISGLVGLRHANRFALEAWNRVYEGRLGIALTDTFGSRAFWHDFDGVFARLFDGVRQDSGDPIDFMKQAVKHYRDLGIDPMSKTIIFSDSLNIDKACLYQRASEKHIKCAFGIGTNLTNDVPGTVPANIVIKLVEIDGIPVVKLSDDPGKAIGDPKAIDVAKWTFSEGEYGP